MAKRLRITWLSAVSIFLAVFLVAAIGSYFTSLGMPEWYASIAKPAWTPPGWVIGAVWTFIFTLTALAILLVWSTRPHDRRHGLAFLVIALNLVLNMLWSYIFFGLGSISGALLEMVFLWFSILAALVLFIRINIYAGLLLLPYLLWVSFAFYLNWSVLVLN